MGVNSKRNTSEPFVSVIVTFYNCEDSVHYCLDSILEQDYSNYEIVCVDDGSTDLTCSALSSYTGDDRVRIFKKDNGGAADARNYGVAHSSGELITFIDGDDLVSPYYLRFLVDAYSSEDCDMAISKMCVVNRHALAHIEWGEDHSYISLSPRQYVEALLYDELSVSTCGRLASRQLYLDKPAIVGRAYEDIDMAAAYVEGIDRAVVANSELYGYVMRPESVVHRFKVNKKQIDDYLSAIDDFATDSAYYVGEGFAGLIFMHSLNYCRIYRLLDKADCRSEYISCCRRKIEIFVRDSLATLLRDHRVSLSNKMRFSAMAVAPKLFTRLFSIYDRVSKGV